MTALIGSADHLTGQTKREVRRSMWRGFRLACPCCGKGSLFGRYLKVVPACAACGEDFSHHRADDAPAYLTMMIVGHVLIIGVASLDDALALSTGVQLAIWLPLATLMTLWLLPRVKGCIVALQWALRMHGFETAWWSNRHLGCCVKMS